MEESSPILHQEDESVSLLSHSPGSRPRTWSGGRGTVSVARLRLHPIEMSVLSSTHVLVATNRFTVGGREAFIGTLLTQLAPQGVRGSLITSSLDNEAPRVELFHRLLVCESADPVTTLRKWMQEGDRLVSENRPTVIWGHQFDLLPTWLLSRRHGIPLLVTFHGPLTGSGRPKDLMQALGMTLAIHHGDAVTGVSQEIIGQLRSLGASAPIHLLPNGVEVVRHAKDDPAYPPKRWLIVARGEKLDHIRAGVLLFARYCRLVPSSRLTIVSAGSGVKQVARRGALARLRQSFSRLGPRWCYGGRASMWRALGRIRWIGHISEPRALMGESDLVLGMGRVVLEALAEGRPAVLVGYGHVCGLMTSETMESWASCNFSGRGVPPADVDAVCGEIYRQRGMSLPDLSGFAAGRWAPVLRDLVFSLPFRDSDKSQEISVAMLTELQRRGASPERIFSAVAQKLDGRELECLYRLAVG